MIIDSHEHLILPTEMQIKKSKEAGVDKSIYLQLHLTLKKQIQCKNLKMKWVFYLKFYQGKKS